MKACHRIAAAACTLALLLVLPQHLVHADDQAGNRAKEMLRRTQEALRQAQSDNAALTQSNVDLQAKLREAERQLDASRNGLNAARGSLRSIEGQQSELQGKYQDVSSRLETATARLNEATKALAGRGAELSQAQQQLAASQKANESCEAKNGLLYQYGQEILARYQHKGVWAALKQKEPVLGLDRVEIENVVQEYRLKLADQKLGPTAH